MPTQNEMLQSAISAAPGGATPETMALLGSAPNYNDPEPLLNFFGQPQYQINYGMNNNQLDPVERFKFDPSYQFLQDEGMRQLQQHAAAKGLLESGATQRDLLGFGRGLADSQYQNWLGNQNNLFNNYQNQLNTLMGIGAQFTGGDQALSQANQTNQYLFGTGQGMASNIYNAANNQAGIYANQAPAFASLLMNTAAAKANNFSNNYMMNKQIQNNNQASSFGNQAAGSLFGGGGGGQQSYTGNPMAPFGGKF